MYEVAALMNSKPLALVPSDDDLSYPLCPQNLLTAKSDVVLPPPGKFVDADLYGKKYWRRLQYLVDQFWSIWRKSYLSDLQSRKKWVKPHNDITVGDVVLVKEEMEPRGSWKMGVIIKVYVSSDGKIRSARLKMGDRSLSKDGKRVKAISYLVRPIHKLILLVSKAEQ